jgi:predicted enzyme related to lactoylglutathione lyase
MLRGFATVTFFADDLEEAGRWYAELTGVQPYFRVYQCPRCGARSRTSSCADCGVEGELGYLELRIGDHEDELGFVHRKWAPHDTTSGPGGAVLFWHVDDVAAALARLQAHGATLHEPLIQRGGDGWATASVVDPFGNVLGVMYNPHYLEFASHA